MGPMNIPFHKLYLRGNELDYMAKALSKDSVSGDGIFNKKVTAFLEDRLHGTQVFTTTSGTHALELAMLLIDMKEGDEVILPSFTFSSTANAVKLYGGKPIFVDIYGDTLALNLEEIEKNITNKTKAIIPVHYGGIGCQMDKIMDLAKKYGLFVVEDAAQALGAIYKGKPLGTWGHMGCFSFHGTKNLVSGEGGAISIQTHEPALKERAEILRQKGTNRQQFFRGEIDRYTWVDIGSSYAPSDLLMAMLLSQLEGLDEIICKRKRLVHTYMQHLEKYVEKGILHSMTNIPEGFQSNYHNFYILLKDIQSREWVRRELGKQHIQAFIHFVPLHSSPMGSAMGYQPGDLPVTQRVGDTLLRLPLYTDMGEEELAYVIERLKLILEGIS